MHLIPSLDTSTRRFALAAGASILLGGWLFVLAFVLPRTFDEQLVEAILGALIVAVSVGASFDRDILYLRLDRILAILLGVAAVVLPSASVASRIDDGGIALCLLAVSFLHERQRPGRSAQSDRRR